MKTFHLRTARFTPISHALRKLGFASLLFFSIKGMLWIAIPTLIAQQL